MSTPRRILYLNEFFHPDICASAAVMTDHLPRIAALRPDLELIAVCGNRAWDDADRVYPASGEYAGVRVVRVDRPAVRRDSLVWRGLGFAAFGRGVRRAAESLRPVDLVIATTAPPHGGVLARRLARRLGCPYIYKVLDLYPDLAATLGRMRAGGFLHRRWLARDTAAMRDAACVVSVTQPMTDRIVRARRLDAARVRTIHDGVDPARVEHHGPNAFAAEHNPQGRFTVQYAGNMGLSHPFETILDAARRLAGDPDVLFQFIGDGPGRSRIELESPPNARLIGYQPAGRLGEVLAAADVCLISQHDGMFDQAIPYKIYAVLAAARPCIFVGHERSEIARWLTESSAGLVVRQGDARSLVEAVASLKADAGRRRAMGSAARRLFDERLHVDVAAARWAALIAEVAANERHLPRAGRAARPA